MSVESLIDRIYLEINERSEMDLGTVPLSQDELEAFVSW